MLNIAIDGVAGSGKSSLAEGLAQKLNIIHFNTGMIYRAIACHFLSTVGNDVNENNIGDFVKNLDVRVWFENGKQKCLICQKDYASILRTERTSTFVSKISPFIQMERFRSQDFH